MTARTGRPRLWVAGPSLLLALVLAGVLGTALALHEGAGRGAAVPATTATAVPAQAAAALHDLVRTVRARAASSSTPLLDAVAANARALDVVDFSARYVDQAGAVRGDGEWSAVVAMTWAFAGFDRDPARAEVLVDFRSRDGRAVITGVGGGGRTSPLWLRGRVDVARGPGSLVLVAGAPREASAAAYLHRVRHAQRVVGRVLPRRRPAAVVEVPASAADLDATLAAPAGTYAGIAALTTGADATVRVDAPVHVFLNPDEIGGPRGAGPVLSHELVHLATGATAGTTRRWLVEGLADYVALRGLRRPTAATADRAVAQVRRHGLPRRLPDDRAFDTRGDDLEAAYQLAWVACAEIADAVGERGLVRVHDAVAGGASVAQALRSVGLAEGAVVRRWRERLGAWAS